ncbi:MAG TPA: hypothetical protein H9837_06620 [Candidatus Brachybacterium merdigallinarum]|nr:hypothetical protein [Candidatus Brachybacterium merdigallinarum]
MSTGNDFHNDFTSDADRGAGRGFSSDFGSTAGSERQDPLGRDSSDWAPTFGAGAGSSRISSGRGRKVGTTPRLSFSNIISAVVSLVFLAMIAWFLFGNGLSSGSGMFPIFFGAFFLIAVLNIVRKFFR